MLRNFLLRTPSYLVFAVWGAGIVAALYSLQHYNSVAGRVGAGVAPVSRCGTTPAPKPRLTMYVHPHCPCTRASLAEFEKLAVGAQTQSSDLAVEIVVVVAPGMEPQWRDGTVVRAGETLIRQLAERSADVAVRFDLDAVEAHRIGALTSGYTTFVSANGDVLFRGGITRSRGHGGDNSGTRALTALLSDRKPEVASTPVFGCPLFDPEACASSEACSSSNAAKGVSQ